jgi:hypothetical protein
VRSFKHTFRSEDGLLDLSAIREHGYYNFCAACDILAGVTSFHSIPYYRIQSSRVNIIGY